MSSEQLPDANAVESDPAAIDAWVGKNKAAARAKTKGMKNWKSTGKQAWQDRLAKAQKAKTP